LLLFLKFTVDRDEVLDDAVVFVLICSRISERVLN